MMVPDIASVACCYKVATHVSIKVYFDFLCFLTRFKVIFRWFTGISFD